jgi:hypothetical protein
MNRQVVDVHLELRKIPSEVFELDFSSRDPLQLTNNGEPDSLTKGIAVEIRSQNSRGSNEQDENAE